MLSEWFPDKMLHEAANEHYAEPVFDAFCMGCGEGIDVEVDEYHEIDDALYCPDCVTTCPCCSNVAPKGYEAHHGWQYDQGESAWFCPDHLEVE